MSSVYRKVSNMLQGSNHDQHDIMDHDHDHETPTGPIKVDNQAMFTQEFATRPIQVYEGMVDVLKQLEDTKRVNEALKDELNEREDHDKTKAFTPASSTQRTPKFPDPEKYGRAREELESFKYAFRVKLRANYDWYPTEDMKLDYAFSCLKNVVRIQMLFRMNEGNVLKFHSVEKLLHCLNVNFGDQNKKQTAQNKIRSLKMGKRLFAEYLAEFQQYISDTGFDIDNQKYSFLTGCSWELQKLLVQHDTDRMTFDEIVSICQVLWIRDQLANQAKPKNYPNFTQPISNTVSTSNIFPVRGYVTPSAPRFTTPATTTFAQPLTAPQSDQGDPMDLSAFRGPKKPLTPEERKYRFDNNLCLYCGKPGHRVMDHKTTTQRVNFITPVPTPVVTSPATAPFVIEFPPQQQGKA